MAVKTFDEALTFDDVLLKPGLSDVMPSEVDIRTRHHPLDRAQHSDHRPPPWTR
ncbi:MAG: hypothetical protein QM722_00410 [Piscinibacter sp.]